MFRQEEMQIEAGKWLAIIMFVVLSGCSGGEGEVELDLFVYNAADGIQSLDPARAVDLETLWVVDQLYEGLLEFDTALNVVPALASEWSVSDGGTVYSFTPVGPNRVPRSRRPPCPG